jgi:NAD(P)-dependent dehydrogenase (short-subunit alcohol dehydrogenase family)
VSETSRIWLITGASSGFGRAIAEAALAAGDTVVGAARRADALRELADAYPGRVDSVVLDVTAPGVASVVNDVVARHGRIDVLVNNAGRTQVGALEETTEEELRYLFELHFFGPALLTRAVLPHMRRQGGGAVVQMSSVGGQITAPGFGAYCATKFALEGLTQTLRQELDFDQGEPAEPPGRGRRGVRFLIVEPGAFRTGLFNPGAAYLSAELPEYAGTVGPTREYVTTGGGSQPGDPAKAAAAILAALNADQPPLRLALGGDAVDSIRAELNSRAAELAAWEHVSRNTAFDD